MTPHSLKIIDRQSMAFQNSVGFAGFIKLDFSGFLGNAAVSEAWSNCFA